jgi:hypothetical protein
MNRLDALEPLRLGLRQKSRTEYIGLLLEINVALNEHLASSKDRVGSTDVSVEVQDILKRIATNVDYNPVAALAQYELLM